MKKKDLIRLIDRAIETEEKQVGLTSMSVSSAIQWMDCSEEDRTRIKAGLSQISRESEVHCSTLTELREKIQKSTKDNF